MRRLAVITECYGVVNGITHSVLTLVAELRKRGIEVVVYAPDDPAYNDSCPDAVRLPSMKLPFFQYRVINPFAWRTWRAIGEMVRTCDIVHSHHPSAAGMMTALLARLVGIEHIATHHTLYEAYAHAYLTKVPVFGHIASWMVRRLVMRPWLKLFYGRSCSAIIAPSAVVQQTIIGYSRIKPIVLPTGVPIPAAETIDHTTQQAARERWRVPDTAQILLYVGRLQAEKSVSQLISAFAHATSTAPDAYLVLIGDGPRRRYLQKLACKLGVSDLVRFLGALPHNQLASHYAAAHWFVSASDTETQGLTVFEARAAGTPCIVTRMGGKAGAVYEGKDGFVAEPFQYGHAIAYALGIEEARYQTMRANCQEMATTHTPEAMAQMVIRLYEQTIDASASPHP